MAIRFVRSAGSVHEPAVVELYASGVVRPGMAVVLAKDSGGPVSVAGSAARITNIFGVCLDYAQGGSDTQVRVIPFLPGQLWEADCISAASTAQVGLKHPLSGVAGAVEIGMRINNTSYDHTAAGGVFLALAVTGATTGSGKLIGEFLRNPSGVQQAGIAGDVYW